MADADDVLKTAGRLFGKLGGVLKQAGSEVADKAKHVTGLGRGEVKLELLQTRAAPGGTLAGQVNLILPEAVTAKRLVVALRARQKVMTVGRSSAGRSISTSHADVYQFEAELGGAQSYETGSYKFELVVPRDALDLRPSGAATANPIADAVRTVASALAPSAGPIEWEVVARLEIAWGRDLSKSVDIAVV